MLQNFIPYSTQSIDESDKAVVIQALLSSHLTQGNITKEFEAQVAAYVGTKYAISFNSATSALYAAYKALKEFVLQDIFQKDSHFVDSVNFKYARRHKTFSILTTPISFVATTNMMLAHDMQPIFGDITMHGNLKLDGLESLLRDDTIAICSVDYAGNSVDMEAFRQFAKKHNLIWISDSSHAFGGSFDNKKVGSMADMSIFSFHAVKPITTCEGGALVSNNDFFAKIAHRICNHGIEKKTLYNHDCVDIGFNFRLHEVGAALGLSQLKRIESFLAKREEIAQFYNAYLHNNPFFYLPKEQPLIKSTRHLYPILLDSRFICQKEHIANKLMERNVGVQVHYKPIYNFSLYRSFNYPILRNAEDFYHAELSIPCHQNMSLELAKKVADSIVSTFESFS